MKDQPMNKTKTPNTVLLTLTRVFLLVFLVIIIEHLSELCFDLFEERHLCLVK